jgi:hypothetical protein
MLKEEYAVRLARRVPLTSSVQEYKMTKQASQPGMLTRKTTPASSAWKLLVCAENPIKRITTLLCPEISRREEH